MSLLGNPCRAAPRDSATTSARSTPSASTSRALSADLRSPQAIASAELAQLTLQGEPLAQGAFRSAYTSARQHALGGGRKPREIPRSRRAAYQLALDQALQADPAFRVTASGDWFNEP